MNKVMEQIRGLFYHNFGMFFICLHNIVCHVYPFELPCRQRFECVSMTNDL